MLPANQIWEKVKTGQWSRFADQKDGGLWRQEYTLFLSFCFWHILGLHFIAAMLMDINKIYFIFFN